jgi:thymidine phosphorylase
MISGRGLGHTGGTLDKLEAIPGYTILPSPETFRSIVSDIGCAIVGASEELAPADKVLYAIRDVTGTVASIDLITASILSKKLAAGLDHLVLDVKTGSGAFMTEMSDATALAQSLTETANAAGCQTRALITDMNEPLASSAGNSLEVATAIRLLTGEAVDNRLWDLTLALGAELLAATGQQDGRVLLEDNLNSGKAAEVFGRMVAGLGGPSDIIERYPSHLPNAPVMQDVTHMERGFVTAIDVTAIGNAVVHLGGGRMRPEDAIDPSVGFEGLAGLGDVVDQETPIARVHAATMEAADAAAGALRSAYTIGATPPDDQPLVKAQLA